MFSKLTSCIQHASFQFQPFYVSPDGNDAWSGTLPNPTGTDGPFLTPSRAAAAVAAVPRPLTGDVNVWLRAGVYALTTPLVLGGPLAGGDGPSSMVRWGKYAIDSGDAVLSGSAAVGGWTPTATTGIWRADLPSAAPSRCRELIVDGRRAWPARVPALVGSSRDESFSDASTLHFVSSLTGCGFNPPACFASCSPAVDEWGCVTGWHCATVRLPTCRRFLAWPPGADLSLMLLILEARQPIGAT